MRRIVEPEWLDQLPADDPLAQRSRRDLRVINTWMGNAKLLARQMRLVKAAPTPRRILDLGAGDGRFMSQVAARLPLQWQGSCLDLLDRRAELSVEASSLLKKRGWNFRILRAEIPNWFQQAPDEQWTIVCANLFLHHFPEDELRQLLQLMSERTSLFVAIEPRRSRVALLASRLVALLGCNQVTRHDAAISVRAGFARRDLSNLWPKNADWLLEERPAGLFSHLFVAKRNNRAAVA
jgi:SAM-dependent methyltransferase